VIDWNLVAKIAGGGFGMVFLVLAILALLVWLAGLAVRRFLKSKSKNEGGVQK
jgi:Na+-transporting methylmalonyl-CoA/oxaloacetate decarboxylase gamma subunit